MDDPTVVFESLSKPVPTVRSVRGKDFGREGTVNDSADFAQRRGAARGKNLHGYVSNSGRFRRTCVHWLAGGVGRELIEETVLRSSADDPDFFYRSVDQFFKMADDDPVFKAEGFENSAHERALSYRRQLAGALA